MGITHPQEGTQVNYRLSVSHRMFLISWGFHQLRFSCPGRTLCPGRALCSGRTNASGLLLWLFLFLFLCYTGCTLEWLCRRGSGLLLGTDSSARSTRPLTVLLSLSFLCLLLICPLLLLACCISRARFAGILRLLHLLVPVANPFPFIYATYKFVYFFMN